MHTQDGAVKLMVVVESRAKAERIYEEDSMLFAEVDAKPEEAEKNVSEDIEAYKRAIVQDFEKCVKLSDF